MSRRDTFFIQQDCDRCHGDLAIRMQSWFNDDTLCIDCIAKEDKAKEELRRLGLDPATMEGCGFVPQAVASIVA